MSRQPIAITSDWDYQVEKVPAFTPEMKPTGSFMTRRVDNGTILKVGVTKDYNVVQNRELVQPVEDVLSDLGLEPTERKAYVMKDGKRMRMRYIFPKWATLWASAWMLTTPLTCLTVSAQSAARSVWFAPTA